MSDNKNSTCIYNGKEYSDGSTVCQGGTLHQCRDGRWDNLGTACKENTDS
ncbi:MAG: DUF1496 domain-containing protein [Allomuricauda sp.]